jgi:hypothetical protein
LIPLLVLALSAAAFGGTLNVSGRAGMYNPGSGISSSVMYGLGADYDITPNFAVRAAAETTTYSVAGNNVTYTPITADLIYRYPILGILTPYLGAGLSYNSYSGATSNSTTGYQAEAGVGLNIGGLRAGIEYRYMIPDSAHSDLNSSSTNAYIEGGFSHSFII